MARGPWKSLRVDLNLIRAEGLSDGESVSVSHGHHAFTLAGTALRRSSPAESSRCTLEPARWARCGLQFQFEILRDDDLDQAFVCLRVMRAEGKHSRNPGVR